MNKNLEAWLRAYQDREGGISERTAGDRLGCGRAVYRTLALGLVPQIGTLQKIAEARQLRLSDLIREIEDTPIAQ